MEEWIEFNQPPRQRGFYVVKLAADDGDDQTDVWYKTFFWSGRKWENSTLLASRYWGKPFAYNVDPQTAGIPAQDGTVTASAMVPN